MQVYLLEVSDFYDQKLFQELLNCVSYQRRTKVCHYYQIIDRKLSLYSALLVQMCLSARCKLPYTALAFAVTGTGKPILSYPEKVYFNVSHTKNGILCCISEKGEVGCDIEKVAPISTEFAEFCCSQAELEYYNSFSGVEQQEAFYRIWTRKEAFLKCSGVGITQNLPVINVLSGAAAQHCYTWGFSDYLCSVYQEEDFTPEIRILSEEDIHTYYAEWHKATF